jgi:rubrerythrin
MLTPTKERGAQTKAMAGMSVTADAEMTVSQNDQLLGIARRDGVNGDFVSDVLSAVLTHERCGTHLYRSCAARSLNPMLQAKYRSFGADTERHVAVLEELIRSAGGNPAYVSPSARMVQVMDTKMVESTYAVSGSVDLMTAEMAMLDAVFLAETMDNANWVLLERLTPMLPEGALRDGIEAAVAEVRAEEEEHLSWVLETKERLVLLQARTDLAAVASMKAEELVARIRNWFA